MSEKYIKGPLKGYKATDKDMQCRGFQFELGKWYECEGALEVCKNGFHFCEQPSGVWSYYNSSTDRAFEIEAEEVLEVQFEAGADFKRVCRKIRLVKEITPGGNSNTGDRNTGDRNTGDCNTGYSNTGDRNTGDRNTGYSNTGDRNTGYSNTGDRNTGNRNTGYSNTGDRNTGDWNTGDRNTGYSNTGYSNTGYSNTGNCNTGYSNTGNCNTGDCNTGNRNTGNCNTGNRNTGNWNATNYSSGFFCQNEPGVICFDLDTKLSREQFEGRFGSLSRQLGCALQSDTPIEFEPYKDLPGITAEKLQSLHEKFIAARKAKAEAK